MERGKHKPWAPIPKKRDQPLILEALLLRNHYIFPIPVSCSVFLSVLPLSPGNP